MLEKIISGGQTGVDQAALRAAIASKLATGGWCPPDGKSEAGPIDSQFGLKPTPRDTSATAPEISHSLRTEWNVRDADATLLVYPSGHVLGPGSQCTLRCVGCFEKSCHRALLEKECLSETSCWLRQSGIRVLNVAGPRQSEVPGVEDAAYRWLCQLFFEQVR